MNFVPGDYRGYRTYGKRAIACRPGPHPDLFIERVKQADRRLPGTLPQSIPFKVGFNYLCGGILCEQFGLTDAKLRVDIESELRRVPPDDRVSRGWRITRAPVTATPARHEIDNGSRLNRILVGPTCDVEVVETG